MPVVNWFNAYYKIGTITSGFEVQINSFEFKDDFTFLKADISFDEATPAHERSMIVVMHPGKTYYAKFNNKNLKVEEIKKGLLQIILPATNQPGELVVKMFKKN